MQSKLMLVDQEKFEDKAIPSKQKFLICSISVLATVHLERPRLLFKKKIKFLVDYSLLATPQLSSSLSNISRVFFKPILVQEIRTESLACRSKAISLYSNPGP